MSRRKLVIVISHPIQYHAPLYRRIAEAGVCDVSVIYHNDRGARPYFEPMARTYVSYDNDLLSGYRYRFLTQGEPSSRSEALRRKLLPDLSRAILSEKPDAVYFHGYNHAGHLAAIAQLGRQRIKVLLRGENEDVTSRPWWRRGPRERLLRWLLPRLDGVLYIGTKNQEFFVQRGFPQSKMFFVPYSADNEYFGIDLPDQVRRSTREDICGQHGMDPNGVVFVLISKHRPEKRPFDVVDAFIKAARRSERPLGASLLLVGDGPLHDALKSRVRESGVESIKFAGFVKQSEMRRYLWASDYCVNAASEPWGCVYNEALPAGLGIISSDRVVGWHDLVHVGSNGFVYRCGCVDSLAHLFRQCAGNPQWISSIRERSREVARTYSFESCVAGIDSALRVLCGN
jgi:glycosyltransferase involved in cell wall biosynthesis